MKKFVFLSLSFLAVFILLIFQSSFCWAFEDELVLDLNEFGYDFYTIDLTQLSDYDDLQYVYVNPYDSNNNLGIYLSNTPGYVQQQNVGSYNIKSTDGFYVAYLKNDDSFTWASKSKQSYFLMYTNYSTFGNTPLYSNSDLTTETSFSNYFIKDDLVVTSGSESMFSVVNNIAMFLTPDNLFLVVQYSIPLIVICVLFVISYILLLKLLRSFPKGKLKL